MTDPEQLKTNHDYKRHIIPRREDNLVFEEMATGGFDSDSLGCDSKRLWLSNSELCEPEARRQRTLLARDLRLLTELQHDEASLNEVLDGHIDYACFSVLNFVIGCNRLAREERLSLALDVVADGTRLTPDEGNPVFKDTRYQATSAEQNLLIHTTSDSSVNCAPLSRPVHGFRPDKAELDADGILFSIEHGTTSLGPNTRDVLRVGPHELELISFRDLHEWEQQ